MSNEQKFTYPNFPKEIQFKEPFYSLYHRMIKDLSIMDFSNSGYTEKHHIIPKSYQGSDDINNIITVTPEYHFELHYLLYKGIGDKMIHAFWRMVTSRGQNGDINWMSAIEYGELKRKRSKLLSDSMTGENNPFFGKTHNKKTIEKLRILHTGRTCSDETKLKMSNARKGKNHPMYGLRGENNPLYGKKRPDHVIKALIKANLGKKHSDETKEKLRKINTGKKLSKKTRQKMALANYKKVICVETGEVFESMKHAAQANGLKNAYAIGQSCRYANKTSGGYHWKFYTE